MYEWKQRTQCRKIYNVNKQAPCNSSFLIPLAPPGPWMPRGALPSAALCFLMAGSWPHPPGWRCVSSWGRRSQRPSTATGCCVPLTQYPSFSSPLPASSPAGRWSLWALLLNFCWNAEWWIEIWPIVSGSTDDGFPPYKNSAVQFLFFSLSLVFFLVVCHRLFSKQHCSHMLLIKQGHYHFQYRRNTTELCVYL